MLFFKYNHIASPDGHVNLLVENKEWEKNITFLAKCNRLHLPKYQKYFDESKALLYSMFVN